MLIDTHAHIQFNAYRDDADEVIKRAIEEDILMIVPSSQITTSERAIRYAEKYTGKVFAAVGLHPIHLKQVEIDTSELGGQPGFKSRKEDFDYVAYKELVSQEGVVAIGEIGLDYAERLEVGESDRREQEDFFRKQIELALEVGKPIIQHCRSGFVGEKKRDAYEDTLRIISEYTSGGLRGVVHCYSGNFEQAKQYIDTGFYISFTGLITFVDLWKDIIKEIPLEHILVETDCPYMTPEPHRGKRNEPIYVKYVAEKIAEIKNISFEEVAEQTTKNAQNLFGIKVSNKFPTNNHQY